MKTQISTVCLLKLWFEYCFEYFAQNALFNHCSVGSQQLTQNHDT